MRPYRRRLLEFYAGLALSVGIACAAHAQGAEAQASTTNRAFRLAFTSSMFADVNENDARAAMKVWIMTISQERHVPVDLDPQFYRSAEQMAEAGDKNLVDGIGLITPEFARLSQKIKFDRFAVAANNGKITEEYVLLVRQDSNLEKLDKLQGRTINVVKGPRMSMALVWLDTLLLEAHLKKAEQFFGRVKLVNKASLAALPVFFNQADACLLTRNSFDVMGELNPQLNRQLRVFAASPGLVPSGFAFRADFILTSRPQILVEMGRLNENPAGHQILTLLQAQQIEDHPVSCLDSTLALLSHHEQLAAEATEAEMSRNENEKPKTRN